MHASSADAVEVRFSESAPTIESSPPLPARQLPRAVSDFAPEHRTARTGGGHSSHSRANGFSDTSRRGDESTYLNIISFSRLGFVRFKAKELEVEYQQYVLKTDAAPHVRFLRFFWVLFIIGAFFFLIRDVCEDPSPFELPLHLYFVNNWEWPVLLGLAVVMALFVLPFVPHPISDWLKRPVKSKVLRKLEERSPHNVRPAVHCWFVLCLLAMGFTNVYPKFMTEEKGLWKHDSLDPNNYPSDDGGFSEECESSRACAEESLGIYTEEAVRAQDNFFTFITVFFLCAVLHLFQPSYARSLVLCASQLLVFAPCLCTSIAIVKNSDFTVWVVFRIIFNILLLLLLLLGSHVHEVQRRQLCTLMYVTRKRNAALHDLNMRMTREVRGNQTRSSRLPPALDLSSPLYKVVKTLHKMQADPLLGHWQVELQQLIDAILNNMQSLLRPNLPGVSKQMKGDEMMAQLMYELPKSHRHAAARPRASGRFPSRDRSWPSQCCAARCGGSMDRFSAPGNCYAGSAKHEAEVRGSTDRKAASSLQAPGAPARAQSNVLELTLPTTGACSSEVSSDEVAQSPTDREASPVVLHTFSPVLAHDGVFNGAKASPATAGSSADVLSGSTRVALPDSVSFRFWGVSPEVRPRSAFEQPERWLPRVPRPMLQDGSAAARQIIRSAMTRWNGHPDPALLKEHGITFADREDGGPFGVFALREIFGDSLLHLMLREAIYSLRLDRTLHFPLQMDALGAFADALTAHYLPVPYHNVVHVCDVLQSSFYLLWRQQQQADSQSSQVLPPLAMLAFVVAAAVHDVAHPGVNNNFITSTISPLALVYNDQHPLENMHVSLGLQLLLQPGNNFVAKLPQARFRQMREWIIESVLATDLSQHFESLERLNLKAAQGSLDFGSDEADETEKKDDIVLFIKNALHAADIGSVGKSWPLYLAWMQRVFQEFFAQGDREKLLGVDPAPFMDRKLASIPKAQQGFINYICLPLFTSLSGLYPQFEFIGHIMRENVQYLQGLEETDTDSILAMPLGSLADEHPSATRLVAGTNASNTTVDS